MYLQHYSFAEVAATLLLCSDMYCLRKRMQQSKEKVKSQHFLDFEKTLKNVKYKM